MTRKAFITGITGQDGSYLAEYLLSQGYEVHGLIRKASTFNTKRIDHLYRDPHLNDVSMFLHYGDITDPSSLAFLINEVQPDEVYNLAAQSHVRVSFDMPVHTGQVTGLGTICLLEAIRRSSKETHFYQASSSEMFGLAPPPQNESTPFHPRSPYAVAKLYSYWITISYRESYGMHASNGILFNHESPRRGETFVTRKIARAAAHILDKRQETLYLGNLEARRDWGYAPEYVVCMTKILNHKPASDFILGTGKSYSVRDFLQFCFDYVGLDWSDYVEIDPRYFRPAEVENLESDPTKAKRELGWSPKILAPDLAKILVDYELSALGLEHPNESEKILRKTGYDWFSEPIHWM
ncbi:MAG: GDP-mannose 4,6-dehydratase [Candidatus Thorarchaeota archaeon]